jgi:hypothetical protein
MVDIQTTKANSFEPAASADIETRTMSKVTWRLVPFLMLCYFIAYLDRVNIGFAGATMRADLDLSAGSPASCSPGASSRVRRPS